MRIFKTRSQATNACKAGKVKINDASVKASYTIEPGQIVQVKKGHIRYTIKVLQIIEKRLSAKLVADKYEDLTPEEEKTINRLPSAFHIPIAKRQRGTGRPTKKERREIDQLKEDIEGLEFDGD